MDGILFAIQPECYTLMAVGHMLRSGQYCPVEVLSVWRRHKLNKKRLSAARLCFSCESDLRV
eukprot:404095-Amphidinium_carterae.2